MNMKVGAPKLDAAIQTNLEAFFTKTPPPAGAKPSAPPEGLVARASVDTGMAPRAKLEMGAGPAGAPAGKGGGKADKADANELSAQSAKVRDDGVKTASHDGNDAIKDMAEMNAMNMKFQVASGLMAMQKGMVEALSKTVKDAGAKVAQLAG